MKFSDERELFAAAGLLQQNPAVRTERATLRNYLRPIAEHRWLIVLITLLSLLIGGAATMTMPRVYEANLLIQIADSAGPTKSILGDTANVFDIKTPATAEMEIMRSRMVVAPAVEKKSLIVVAQPRYFPLVGGWYSREQQNPWSADALGTGMWAHPERSIVVRQFEVPAGWEGQTFVLKVAPDGRYSLRHSSIPSPLQGKVGEPLTASLGDGKLTLVVAELKGETGAEFSVVRKTRGKAVEDLQDALKLAERGRQSGIIEVTLRDTDPARAAAILNAIGTDYVKQSVDRKSAEAEKTLAFLNSRLPALKQQVDRAEDAYNAFRSRRGSVSLEDEARIAVNRISDLNSKLAETQQKKRDLLSEFGRQHPSVRVLDEQISGLQGEIRGLQGRISTIPATQQDAQRLEREVKSSSDLYQQLRNNALQLQLVREGLSGNARIIDPAVAPDDPIRPKAFIVMGVAASAGLSLSVLLALLRSGLARSVATAREVEAVTGLSVYSSAIPQTAAQRRIRNSPQPVVALSAPSDEAAVGLRQLRTLLQHQLRGRANNRLMLAGATDGVGVHFLLGNLGAISAAAGRRTLLIDADRHNGSLHRSFGVDSTPGLTELLSGSCTRKEVIRSTDIPRLDVVSAGSAPGDFDELATSREFMELLEHASKEYELVLVAAPPILQSSETLSLALTAAMVVLVARVRRTAIDDVAESARRLTQAGQIPTGVVLNGV